MAKRPTTYVYEAFDMGTGDWGCQPRSLGLFPTLKEAKLAAKGKGGMGCGDGRIERRQTKRPATPPALNVTLFLVFGCLDETGTSEAIKGIYTDESAAKEAAKGCGAWGANGRVQRAALKGGKWCPK